MAVVSHSQSHCIIRNRKLLSFLFLLAIAPVTCAEALFDKSLFGDNPSSDDFHADEYNDSLDDKKLDHRLFEKRGYTNISFYGSTSQRKAELRWNIASDASGSKTPNILSELTFADLSLSEVQAGVDVTFNYGRFKDFTVEASIKAGNNSGGMVTDSDYDGDDRTDEYSRSESNPEGSTTIDGKLLLGYQIQWSNNIFVTSLVGYSFNQQSLRMKEGVQILDTRAAALSLGPFSSSLNSRYEATWNSAVLGIDAQYRGQKHQLGLRWEFFLSDYYAEANWNLRSDFAHPKSFSHWAQGNGNNIEVSYQYNVTAFFSLWASFRIENWETNEGDDVVYFSDGTKAGTQLNEVIWESSTSTAGFSLNF